MINIKDSLGLFLYLVLWGIIEDIIDIFFIFLVGKVRWIYINIRKYVVCRGVVKEKFWGVGIIEVLSLWNEVRNYNVKFRVGIR